jgi:hypothetical protein
MSDDDKHLIIGRLVTEYEKIRVDRRIPLSEGVTRNER